MFLSENFHFDKSASIAFDQSNVNELSPNPNTWTPKARLRSLRGTPNTRTPKTHFIRFGEPLYKQKRARIRGENTSVLALVFSVDIFTFVKYVHERWIWYVLALLELDILTLCVNSIWDKSLVCVANISSRRQHRRSQARYSVAPHWCSLRKSRQGFISMRVLR